MVLAMPSFDAGNVRDPKRFTDVYVEAAVEAAISLDLWLSRYTNHDNGDLSQASLPTTGGVRTGTILYLAGALGVHANDLALVFTVPLGPAPTGLIYLWLPTFAPWPELISAWQTDLFSLAPEWAHIRDINLDYLSTVPLTFALTFDPQSPPIPAITVPSSNGKQQKLLLLVPPNKFKMVGFSVYGSAGFQLWKEDLEVKLGAWGRKEGYQILRPFSGPGSGGSQL
jgi:hypothetical protein